MAIPEPIKKGEKFRYLKDIPGYVLKGEKVEVVKVYKTALKLKNISRHNGEEFTIYCPMDDLIPHLERLAMTEEEIIRIAKELNIVCDYQMSAERFVFSRSGTRQVKEVEDIIKMTPEQFKAFLRKEFK